MTNLITINDGSGRTTSPSAVGGPYTASVRSRNIVTDLLNGDIAVALFPARPRGNRLQLVYETETDAVASVELHGAGASLTWTTDELEHAGMTYVLADGGNCTYAQGAGYTSWVVTLDYQEILP